MSKVTNIEDIRLEICASKIKSHLDALKEHELRLDAIEDELISRLPFEPEAQAVLDNLRLQREAMAEVFGDE